jgi:hypothetical protein
MCDLFFNFLFCVLECVARRGGGATGRWRELVIARGRAGCARVGSDRGWGCRCVPGVLGVGGHGGSLGV